MRRRPYMLSHSGDLSILRRTIVLQDIVWVISD